MRKEEKLIKGLILGEKCQYPYYGPDSEVYQDLPICNTVEDVEKKAPKGVDENAVFNATEFVMHEYMQKMFFDCNIYDFMELYSELRFGKPSVFPIEASKITCVLRKVLDARILIEEHRRQLSSALHYPDVCGSSLDLHDNSVYILTLIECDFDISQYKSQLMGCYYKSKKHCFKIKSSVQWDLTILYQKLD